MLTITRHQTAYWLHCVTAVSFYLSIKWEPSYGQTYNDSKAIFDDKLSSSVYNADIRPLQNQSAVMSVELDFELLSVVEIDDVGSKFLCNGFLWATWTDELVQWSTTEYGGAKIIYPNVEKVWRPRIVLLNTLAERDLFDDDHAPLSVSRTGKVVWAPGSLFPTSCNLNMTYYPFDRQTCIILMVAMNGAINQLEFFTTSTEVGLQFYIQNGEWELEETKIFAASMGFEQVFAESSGLVISFTLKRRPLTIMINIVLPVVFMSFLNLLVFVIPVDSGEKIGFGITVLLSLSVYLSALSSLLPSSAETVPRLIIYLFSLLVVGVCTVIVSIIIVCLHNMEIKDESSKKTSRNFNSLFSKVKTLNRSVMPIDDENDVREKKHNPLSNPTFVNANRSASHGDSCNDSEHEDKDTATDEKSINKYKIIGKYIDQVAFVVFSVIWLGLTLGFLIHLSTS